MDHIYIPFPKALYDDIVVLSQGRLDPAEIAPEQVLDLIERNLDSIAGEWFGKNLNEFVRRQLPASLKQLSQNSNPERVGESKSLFWKTISLPQGTTLRMTYGGKDHYAKVENGKVKDADGYFSPSRWARKVANNTSRSAPRDIFFKRPSDINWTNAKSAIDASS